MILVTGADGSVGRALVTQLERKAARAYEVVAHDIATMDVTNAEQVRWVLDTIRPSVIFHLAGAKHAPAGELDPFHVLQVNAIGTQNVLDAAGEAKVVLASTCKACDPETAYGASKLVAERMVLNAGGVVVRFHNIPESSDNVFRLWESLDPSEPIAWTDCWRYFTPMEQAVELLVEAPRLPTGRYCVAPGDPEWMGHVAARLYPDRVRVQIPRRRGDRHREPLHAVSEQIHECGAWLRVTGEHDPVVALKAAA